MLKIDVHSSRELQALILSIRQANKEVQAQIRRHTKPMAQSAWQKGLSQEAMTSFEHRVLVDTARVSVSNQNVRLKAGSLARKLSGGGRARDLAKQAEFGAGLKRIQYTGRRGGKSFPVTRTSGGQFRPWKKTGHVAYPAAARIIPRIAALWTQTAVRTFHEALEQKG